MRAILIIAYRRADSLSKILEECLISGIRNVYIQIDGPKNQVAASDVEKVHLVAQNFAKNENINVKISAKRGNLGCSVSLISALDYLFESLDEVIVLEDDCLPSKEFWKFADQGFEIMNLEASIGLFCGPQFGPKNLLSSEWFLSSYPFHWGWGINSRRWLEIRDGLFSTIDLNGSTNISVFESRYWNAGCRRAVDGFTDVWDTLFVRQMLRLGLKALLPPENLINNLGNDEIALHTSENSIWTNYEIGSYRIQNKFPKNNPNFDQWARSEYFKISRRHLISTRLSLVRDKIKKPKYYKTLPDRLEASSVIFA